jgi:hypothetical protein
MTTTERNLGGKEVLIEDAIDMHVHFGPEPLIDMIFGTTHAVNPIQAATEARDAGMAAIVLKSHEFPSTMTQYLAQAAVPDVQIFSGIVCDHPVGGINPYAVEVALRSGAKMIWLPTISAIDSPLVYDLFGTWDRHAVIDEDGEILPHVKEVFELAAKYDATIATGHTTAAEHYAVGKALQGKVRVVATHVMQAGNSGPNLTPQQCLELADLGVYIEFTAFACQAEPAKADAIAKTIQALPHGQVLLSSDFGWNSQLPRPVPGLKSYVSGLWELGVPEELLRFMVTENPRKALGIA